MKTQQENNCMENNRFEDIYSLYYERMVAYATKILGSDFFAEDIIQDVFMGIYQQNLQFIAQQALQTYLFRSVYNKCIDFIRRKELNQKYQDAYVEEYQIGVVANPIDYKELSIIVEKRIDRLPRKCKQIFNMKYRQEKSNPEISQTLGLSIKTVENQVFIARNVLRSYLHSYLCS